MLMTRFVVISPQQKSDSSVQKGHPVIVFIVAMLIGLAALAVITLPIVQHLRNRGQQPDGQAFDKQLWKEYVSTSTGRVPTLRSDTLFMLSLFTVAAWLVQMTGMFGLDDSVHHPDLGSPSRSMYITLTAMFAVVAVVRAIGLRVARKQQLA
jgi:hypothetical protein